VSDPLDGLDAIDWSAIEHAYGTADDVPGLLRALRSPRRRERTEALRALRLNIIHQNSHWPGSPEAAPFVAALALDPATPDRPALVEYLAYLYGNVWYIHLVDPRRYPDPPDELWGETREVIDQRMAAIERLLDDDDPEVVEVAGFLLAWSTRASPALIERLAVIASGAQPHAAASATLALGVLAARGRIDTATVAGLARAALAGEDEIRRAAAAIAFAWLGEAEEPEVLDALEQAVLEPPFRGRIGWPDTLGSLPVVFLGRPGPLARDSTLKVVLRQLGDEGIDSWRQQQAAGLVLDALFRDGSRGDLLPDDLSATERRALVAIARSDALWSSWHDLLRDRGLPRDRHRLLAWLGRIPPDLLETRLSHGTDVWPVWKIILAGGRDDGERSAAVRSLAAGLTPREVAWLTAWYAFEPGACWGIEGSGDRDLIQALALEVLGDASLLDLRPATGEPPDFAHLDVFLRAVADGLVARRQGRVPDPAGDRLLAEAVRVAIQRRPLDAILDLLPAERRSAIVCAALDGGACDGVWMFLDGMSAPGEIAAVVGAIRRLGADRLPRPAVIRWMTGLAELDRARLAAGDVGGKDPVGNLARIATALVRGAELGASEVRWEIHLRFRAGMTLQSGEETGGAIHPMFPCPLCAQVYRELGLHPDNLGPGATGGILAPAGGDSGNDRSIARVAQRGWQGITVRRGDPVAEDPAITEAIDNALRHGHELTPCVELAALHALAGHIRAELSGRPS